MDTTRYAHPMPETTVSPYLTVPQVADELEISTSGVYKLIQRGRLPVLKLSERRTRIARWALDAYIERINGRGPDTSLSDEADPQAARSAFEHETRLTPEAWIVAWKRDEIPDTARNTERLVRALALRRPATGKDASPDARRLVGSAR